MYIATSRRRRTIKICFCYYNNANANDDVPLNVLRDLIIKTGYVGENVENYISIDVNLATVNYDADFVEKYRKNESESDEKNCKKVYVRFRKTL